MKHELVQARDATGMQLRGNSMLCGYYRGYANLFGYFLLAFFSLLST